MLRELRRNLVALTTTRRGSPLAAGHQRLRPVLECLEDRTVPAALSYSSYLPGPAFAIAVDSAGEAFVAGTTSLDIFSGSGSAYVAKLNATGLLYLTYLGSNGHNMAGGIALDSAGNAYVSGWTSSTNFPT